MAVYKRAKMIGAPFSWANQCDYKHDTAEHRAKACGMDAKAQVGQNLARAASKQYMTEDMLGAMFNGWWNEIQYFDPWTMVDTYTKNDKWGHFTQLLWANTKKVGCGFIYYARDGTFEQVR